MKNHLMRALANPLRLLSGLLILGASLATFDGLQAETSLSEAELIAKARSIHSESLVLDAHADIVIPSTSLSYLGEGGVSKVSPAKLEEGGVNAVVMSVAVGPGPRTPESDAEARAMADEKLAAALQIVSDASSSVVLARTAREVETAKAEGNAAIILGFQNARSLEGDVSALDHFYEAGVRVFGLNHLGHNDFSDSSRPLYDGATRAYEATEEHGGLSPLGIAAVERINELGGIVDISQLSKAAALQTISLSRAPVIASHSNVRAISNVTRNLSDEEIDLIGEKDGVIHVAAFGAYLVALTDPDVLAAVIAVRLKAGLPAAYSYPYELYWELEDPAAQRAFLIEMRSTIGAGAVTDMVAHINYIVERIGVEHVGIGNDFNHGSNIEGYGDASEALNLTIELVRAGYSAEDISKILGWNFLRVFREAEEQRTVE
jgi:membrane dipeptidase